MYNVSVCLKNDNIRKYKQRSKRTISWNKYGYLIDPTFRNINRLFVLSFKNGGDDPTRYSFDKYYIPLVEIKDFNALIDNDPLFDQPVKNKKSMKNFSKCLEIMTIQQEIYYISSYHQNYYELNEIDL